MDDPEVNDYLNNLGHRLVAALPEAGQEFEFFAVPDTSINAFALPGGYIGVNTGLILLAQNESELASVLAHEISHITQHHLARMMSAQKGSLWMQLAALAVAIAAARSGGSNGGQLASAALSPARRRSRSRTSSTSPASTSTKPTASASSGSTWPASTSTRWQR